MPDVYAATVEIRAGSAVDASSSPGHSSRMGGPLCPAPAADAWESGLYAPAWTDRTYEVELTAADGTAHARVEKTVHVRRRERSGP